MKVYVVFICDEISTRMQKIFLHKKDAEHYILKDSRLYINEHEVIEQ